MFSLIVSIIAVVLTASIAVATIYYGGSNVNVSGSRALAEQLVNDGEHLTSAGALYQNDHSGSLPAQPTALAPYYLSEIPLPPAASYAKGLAAPVTSDWTYLPGTANIILPKLSKSACDAVNSLYGIPSIPPALDSKYLIQCYGTYEPYTFYFDPPGGNPVQAAQIAASMPPPPPANAVGIVAASNTRTFADGSMPASCNAYRNPAQGYSYTGATGDGIYRISENGTAQDVYCDMTTMGGGWTVVEHVSGAYPADTIWYATTAASAITPNASSALFLPASIAIPLAKVSSAVLIYDAATPANYVMTSDSTMLGNLQAGLVMNYNITDATPYFTMSSSNLTQLNKTCGNTTTAASTYPSIFWPCGNTQAMDVSLYSDGVHGLAGWTSSGGHPFVVMYR